MLFDGRYRSPQAACGKPAAPQELVTLPEFGEGRGWEGFLGPLEGGTAARQSFPLFQGASAFFVSFLLLLLLK